MDGLSLVQIGPVILLEIYQFTSAEDLGCNIKRFTVVKPVRYLTYNSFVFKYA